MSIRQKIIDHLKDRLNDMIPNTPMIGLYEKTINAMTDEQLEAWIQALENGSQDFPDLSKPSDTISLIVPNLDKNNRLNITRNLALAEKMGHEFFEQVWLTNEATGQVTLTNRKYLCMDIPIRRQAQTLDLKISVADDDNVIDDLTGQVTGDSKGSSISYPEVQMLDAQGLSATLNELLRARGGDTEAWRLMKSNIIKYGQFSQEELDTLDSRAKVNETFSKILKAMHIRNNL